MSETFVDLRWYIYQNGGNGGNSRIVIYRLLTVLEHPLPVSSSLLHIEQLYKTHHN